MQDDQAYMLQAIEMAKQGGKAVRPNPLVGAVLVKDSMVVGVGYHSRYGAAHAEREAIDQAGPDAKDATLYVTLEPCNHTGKTPPCTEAIIGAGISRIVIGMRDPNPSVEGKGAERLMDHGIECSVGVCQRECRELNEVYLANVIKNRPFIQLKIAQSIDGFIAPSDGNSKWITGELARTEGHRLRSRTDAIMIGSGTLAMDNPELTVRLVDGDQPTRILLTDTLDLPLNAKIFTDEHVANTAIFVTENAPNPGTILGTLKNRGVDVAYIREDSFGRADAHDIMKKLLERDLYAVMIEGGAGLYSTFLKADVVDRIDLFIAPKVFGSGMSIFQYIPARTISSAFEFNTSSVRTIGNDIHAVLRRK